VAESAFAALRLAEMIKVVNGYQHHMLHSLHNELRDSFTAFDLEWLNWIGVDQQHLEFAAVPTIDETRRIETGHAVF
jgi:hypothetical protein